MTKWNRPLSIYAKLANARAWLKKQYILPIKQAIKLQKEKVLAAKLTYLQAVIFENQNGHGRSNFWVILPNFQNWDIFWRYFKWFYY